MEPAKDVKMFRISGIDRNVEFAKVKSAYGLDEMKNPKRTHAAAYAFGTACNFAALYFSKLIHEKTKEAFESGRKFTEMHAQFAASANGVCQIPGCTLHPDGIVGDGMTGAGIIPAGAAQPLGVPPLGGGSQSGPLGSGSVPPAVAGGSGRAAEFVDAAVAYLRDMVGAYTFDQRRHLTSLFDTAYQQGRNDLAKLLESARSPFGLIWTCDGCGTMRDWAEARDLGKCPNCQREGIHPPSYYAGRADAATELDEGYRERLLTVMADLNSLQQRLMENEIDAATIFTLRRALDIAAKDCDAVANGQVNTRDARITAADIRKVLSETAPPPAAPAGGERDAAAEPVGPAAVPLHCPECGSGPLPLEAGDIRLGKGCVHCRSARSDAEAGAMRPAADPAPTEVSDYFIHDQQLGGYPDPTPAMMASPEFLEVWKAIEGWDIKRPGATGYAGATGNDVRHILEAVARSGWPVALRRRALADIYEALTGEAWATGDPDRPIFITTLHLATEARKARAAAADLSRNPSGAAVEFLEWFKQRAGDCWRPEFYAAFIEEATRRFNAVALAADPLQDPRGGYADGYEQGYAKGEASSADAARADHLMATIHKLLDGLHLGQIAYETGRERWQGWFEKGVIYQLRAEVNWLPKTPTNSPDTL